MRDGRAMRKIAAMDAMETTCRSLKILILLGALCSVAGPSAAFAASAATIRIQGKGSVREVTPAERFNCTNAGAGTLDCGRFHYPTFHFVKIQAEAADGWAFDGWSDTPGDLCDDDVTTCEFTSAVCVFCVVELHITAKFESLDTDGDGYYPPADCDETSRDVNPGKPDLPYNRVDEDCVGGDETDVDNDGSDHPVDCDDRNSSVKPGTLDTPYNGIDENCDGTDEVDVDNDGSNHPADCNDNNPDIKPGGREIPYNGADENCDGGDLVDADRDGINFPIDCDDGAFTVRPGAAEVPGNGIDEDCSGADAPATSVPGSTSSTSGPPASGVLESTPACTVPKLRGKTLRAARRALRSSGCVLGRVDRRPSRTMPKGRVLSQTRRPGRRLAFRAAVGVRVSRG
jgi:hypothetical protein